MIEAPSIRLLASNNNARGDLFTRLTKDLFFALGYDVLRFDVHKTGREIDIQGEHRHEPKRMIAECKAHAKKIGGDDLNKFFGSLSRERSKTDQTPVTGYFISLSGFRESGMEQELETAEQERIIPINGKKLTEELQRSRVLIDHVSAIERAGRCFEQAGINGPVFNGIELLGHEIGYIWAVTYSHGKETTHVALIHADGTPLSQSIARKIITSDKELGGELHKLSYLAPPTPTSDHASAEKAAIKQYCQWIAQECGCIQLDGLPADTDLSATRLKLEQLFVPLKVVIKADQDANKHPEEDQVETLGAFLETHPHIALLASPGGGKSTLLKRLATAYADPSRRAEVNDALPEREWLPLLIRCRDLQGRERRPILEQLTGLPRHVGMSQEESMAFSGKLLDALRKGRALVLIDGLDEISDEGDRQVFAQNLRTFLGMFPHTALVVTSREAGFRHIAGVIAGSCKQVRLANFDKDDVHSLCESWHVEVVGDTEKVRNDARELASTIWGNARIRRLVENPLLLTTLLIVKRCVGELPRNRVELYRKAIEVLVRTWNVEGYEPLDEGETLAQLSYLACIMMERGEQQIGHNDLIKLLQKARKELEAELMFTKISPSKFVKRIEYRSSVLMQTGHEIIDGTLQAVYEFRHLTFQEYLAARGFVEEQYAGRDDGKDLADLLEPHFEDESWHEVIPLSTVLAGRKAESTIKRLANACATLERNELEQQPSQSLILTQCLIDEVQIPPSTLHKALTETGRLASSEFSLHSLFKGKYGTLLKEITIASFISGKDNWDNFYAAYSAQYSDIYSEKLAKAEIEERLDALSTQLNSQDRNLKIAAAFSCMSLTFYLHRISSDYDISNYREAYDSMTNSLCDMIFSDDSPQILPACWALAWIGETGVCPDITTPSLLHRLFDLWRSSESKELSRFAAWAFAALPLLERNSIETSIWKDCDDFIREEINSEYNGRIQAALVNAWYRQAPWSDAELTELISETPDIEYSISSTAGRLLENLGEEGARILKKWRQENQ